MGPRDDTQTMRAIAAYRRMHPQVIIKEPAETASKLWEVSLPSRSTMAFDDPQMMLTALLVTRVPEE